MASTSFAQSPLPLITAYSPMLLAPETTEQSLVVTGSNTMVNRMVLYQHYGQRIGGHNHQFLSLGPSSPKKQYQVSLRQPRSGSLHKQGLIQGHYGDAPSPMTLVLHHSFDIHITAAHISRKANNVQRCCPETRLPNS